VCDNPRPAKKCGAKPIQNDADAKAEVAKFMDAVGFDAVDCGMLAESWRIRQAARPGRKRKGPGSAKSEHGGHGGTSSRAGCTYPHCSSIAETAVCISAWSDLNE
jgi:hypothetical protein